MVGSCATPKLDQGSHDCNQRSFDERGAAEDFPIPLLLPLLSAKGTIFPSRQDCINQNEFYIVIAFPPLTHIYAGNENLEKLPECVWFRARYGNSDILTSVVPISR